MLNAVGREIPEEILERTGKEVFQGNNYKDGKAFQKASPKVTPVMRNDHDKMVKDIHEALVKCNAHDGMTVSFHHHFREGDLVVCMVMEEIHKMGFKNITLSASSLGKAHDALVPMIEDGTIVNIESSGVRGKIGDAISHGKLKGLATMRSHGGRVRAIETGETHVDIAFIGAPSCDEYGNCSGMGGKTNCGVLSYAYVDAEMADYVVAVTDCLVDYPNYPAEINQTKVDYVCVVDQIGIPEKIATGAAKPTTDQRKILMAEYCTQVVANTPVLQGRLLLSDRCRRRIHRLHYLSVQDHGREEHPYGSGRRWSDQAHVRAAGPRSGPQAGRYAGLRPGRCQQCPHQPQPLPHLCWRVRKPDEQGRFRQQAGLRHPGLSGG